MNFTFLVESCVAQFKGKSVTKRTAEQIIRNVFNDIASAMERGERLSVRDFGIFDTVVKNRLTYTDPRTGNPIQVEAKPYPKWIPSRRLKKAVNARGVTD